MFEIIIESKNLLLHKEKIYQHQEHQQIHFFINTWLVLIKIYNKINARIYLTKLDSMDVVIVLKITIQIYEL